MTRDLSDEAVETDLLPEPEPVNRDALETELRQLEQQSQTFATPGWDLLVSQWAGKREADYRALGDSAGLSSMEQVNLVRGEITILNDLLTAPQKTAARIAQIHQTLGESEPDQQEA